MTDREPVTDRAPVTERETVSDDPAVIPELEGSRSRLLRLALALEERSQLDGAVRGLERWLPAGLGRGRPRAVLGGRWLGHALHPLLTDFPLGAWMSASLLDLIGGPESRPASRRLIGFGVVMAGPTAIAGASDWLSATPRQRRVGIVHATANTTALVMYGASLVARRRGRHGAGVALGIGGGVVATAGGFLGGHLSLARDTGLRATASALGSPDRGSEPTQAAPLAP